MCFVGDGAQRPIEPTLYMIKYYFISSMNIFYCCTDILLPFCDCRRMAERGEPSRPRVEEVREVVPEAAVDIRGFTTDVITVSYDTIPGYVMPRITIDVTPEEE